jgi:glucokinase
VLGEAWRGAARGSQDAIYLIVGTGIGAGILSGGRLVRGAHELSGCAGWMPVAVGDEIEPLEKLTAGPAVGAAGAAAMGVTSATARDVVEVVRLAAYRLGLAVSSLISLFDPDVIVLGGGLGGSGETLLRPLRATATRYAQPLSAKLVRVTYSRLGPRAQLLGAAKCALDYLNEGLR